MKPVVLFFIFSLFLLSGCHTVGGGIRVSSGHHYQDSRMPPAHAPAHGRRQLHHYQYYPNAEFYFDVYRNMYFYLDSRGQWSFSVNLPLHLRSHLGSGYVEIEMDSDRPYSRHKYYKNKYKKHRKYKRNYKAKEKYRDNDRHLYKKKYKKKSKKKSKYKDEYRDKEKKKRSKKGKYNDEYEDEDDENRDEKRRKYRQY